MLKVNQLAGFGAGGPSGPTEFTTFDPDNKGSTIVLSNGNLTVTNTGTNDGVRGIAGKTVGKHYFELINGNPPINRGSTQGDGIGICNATWGLGGYCNDENAWGMRANNGNKKHDNNESAYGVSYELTGDIAMCAYNADTGEVFFGTDGTWANSGNPATGANPAFTGITGTIYPMGYVYNSGDYFTCNFGSTAFNYTPPTGFYGWGV
jgi:hypothetical protein